MLTVAIAAIHSDLVANRSHRQDEPSAPLQTSKVEVPGIEKLKLEYMYYMPSTVNGFCQTL